MIVNESRIDRALRGAGAAASLIVAFSVGATSPAGIALLVLAALLTGTAGTGFCPVYWIFGFRTNKPARTPESRQPDLVRH